MEIIKIKRKIENDKAKFYNGDFIIAEVKQNRALPKGFYRGKVNGFGNLFEYEWDFNDAVENISQFIKNTFYHNFRINIEFENI